MIDQLFCIRNHGRFELDTAGYTPDGAITKRQFNDIQSQKLAVLFSPWHGAGWFYEHLARRLQTKGHSTLLYGFSPEILKPDIPQVLGSFAALEAGIRSDLDEINKTHDFKDVHFIGSSLGNLPIALLAENYSAFNKVTMIVPGSSLARATWEGMRTRDIRDALKEQGVNEEQLSQAWANLELSAHVKPFTGKQFHLIVSDHDPVIPTKFQYEYLAALTAVKPDLTVTHSRVGHYATIINFCLRGVV